MENRQRQAWMRRWPPRLAALIITIAAILASVSRRTVAAAARASAAPAFVPIRTRACSATARLTIAMPRQATKKIGAGKEKAAAAAAAPATAKAPTTTRKKAPSSGKSETMAVAAAAPATATARRRKRPAAGDDGESAMAAAAAALTPAVAPAVAAAATEGGKRAKLASAKEIVVPPATAAAAAATGALLFTLPPLLRAVIVNRPSKVVKSPYLADIKLLEEDEAAAAAAADGGGKGNKKRAGGKGQGKTAADLSNDSGDSSEETHMAHTPSLGCGNLVSAGASVLVSRSTSATAKSKFVLHHVLQREGDGSEHLVGTHPQTAEKLALAIIQAGFAVGPVTAVAREVTMGNSRFDFVVTHGDGSTTVVECKNVPIADYCDGTKKERAATMAGPDAPSDPYGKLGIFPEGYRKKVNDPVSPRALKHIHELQAIAEQRDPTRRAMLLFVTQRTDVRALCITKTDVQYRAACQAAAAKGVALKAFAVRWEGNRAYLHKELPFLWED